VRSLFSVPSPRAPSDERRTGKQQKPGGGLGNSAHWCVRDLQADEHVVVVIIDQIRLWVVEVQDPGVAAGLLIDAST
jgi:hypothetical protein